MRRPATATWSTFAARRGHELDLRHLPPSLRGIGHAFATTRGRYAENKNAGHFWPAFCLETSVLSTCLVEQGVDIILRCVADVAFQLRTIQEFGIALSGIDDRRRMRLDGVDAAPDIHHDGNVMLDELHRVHHLLDALAGEVLEIAGFENRDDALLDFLAEQLLLIRRSDPAQRRGRIVDRLGGFED